MGQTKPILRWESGGRFRVLPPHFLRKYGPVKRVERGWDYQKERREAGSECARR